MDFLKITVEGFDVEKSSITFPMDAGFVLPHLKSFFNGPF